MKNLLTFSILALSVSVFGINVPKEGKMPKPPPKTCREAYDRAKKKCESVDKEKYQNCVEEAYVQYYVCSEEKKLPAGEEPAHPSELTPHKRMPAGPKAHDDEI